MKSINIISRIALFSFILVIPLNSYAWGVLGHRIVGEIAFSHLNPKAKKGVRLILENQSVAMSSTWMDFIKSDPSYKYLGNWHYVNFIPGLTYPQLDTSLKKDTTTNIYTKINYVFNELEKKESSREMKQMHLRILIHLVGDLHQPLHCGRAEDSGGNNIKVSWFNKPTNLHTLWDSELIDFQQLSYTEYATAINHSTVNNIHTWQNDDITKWVYESYQLSDELYKEAQGDNKYSYKYNFDHIDTLNLQLLKGGVRLAGLLNKLFE